MNTLRHKLQPPLTRAPLLPRPKLNALIDQALRCGQSTLIVAPAGWGKTTSLSAWASATELGCPIHWYSIDPGDCDPAVFLHYILTAIAPHNPALHLIVQQMTRAEHAVAPGRSLLQQMIDALAQQDAPRVLIIDDIHLIEQQDAHGAQQCLALIEQLVLHTSLRVVLLSRQVLRSCTSLVVRDHVQMVERQLLTFSSADVTELAELRYDACLDAARAERLAQWAGGWPAAVVLGLEHWARTQALHPPALDALLPDVAENYLYPFLADQILRPLSPDLQQFLLDTAVLEELSVEHCNELRDTDDADRQLEALRQCGLVVSTSDSRVHVFGLFRSFLLSRLGHSPKRLQALTQRAAELYEGAGQPELAFRLWLSLPDVAAAARLLRTYGPRLRQQGQHLTVQHWLSELQAHGPLPVDLYLVAARVAMDLADWSTVDAMLCMAAAHGDRETWQEARLLEAAVACIRDNERRAAEILAQIDLESLPVRLRPRGLETAGRVALAQGAVGRATDLFRQALVLIEAQPGSGESPAQLYDLLGMATAMQGQSELASYYLQRADAIWKMLGAASRRVSTLNNLGSLALEDGRLDDARGFYYAGLELAEQLRRYRSQVLLWCGLAEIALIEGQTALALDQYEQAFQIARGAQLSSLQGLACAGGLRAAALSNDLERRRCWVERLDQLPSPGGQQTRLLIGLAQGMLAVEPGPALAALAALPGPGHAAALDRAQLALLRAQLAFRAQGWAGAAPAWGALELLQPRRHLDGVLRTQLARTPELLTALPPTALAGRLAEAPAALETAAAWQVDALGGFRILRDGAPCDAEVRPIDQLLLVRLLEAGPTGLAVLKLWSDVWGERDYSSDALRQALRRLRRATDLPIQMRGGHCLLQICWSSLAYDVARFEAPGGAADDPRALEAARAAYRGPLLCHLRHESPWLEHRRQTLHRRLLLLTERLAVLYEPSDLQQALQLYLVILAEDPCRELATAGAMRCYAELGQRAQAIEVYQQARRALDTELGLEPSPLVEQLYHDLI